MRNYKNSLLALLLLAAACDKDACPCEDTGEPRMKWTVSDVQMRPDHENRAEITGHARLNADDYALTGMEVQVQWDESSDGDAYGEWKHPLAEETFVVLTELYEEGDEGDWWVARDDVRFWPADSGETYLCARIRVPGSNLHDWTEAMCYGLMGVR